MNSQAYLIKHGWEPHPEADYIWVDPQDGSRRTMTSALAIQHERDAEQLDIALAALALAEPIIERHQQCLDTTMSSSHRQDADAALAAVRAARNE